MAQVIRIYGKAKVAHVDGETIERQDEIFVPSYRTWYRTVEEDPTHFSYRTKEGKMGSTLMCTCGSIAAIYNPDVYMRFTSVNRGQIIACRHYMENGHHADGVS
jgi:hypothetical protein